MAVTRLADVIVPEVFGSYVQTYTEEKSRLISSGALVVDSGLSAQMAGPGLIFHMPFYRDLANDPENISTDDPAQLSTPYKIDAGQELIVRLNRNNSWSSMDLISDLTGSDPMQAIVNRVGDYWIRRLQLAWIAEMKGIFADNDAAPSGADTHLQGDLTFDVSGSAFIDGTTNFHASAFVDAVQTMGDSQEALGLVLMHSVVYSRAKKNNLIDFMTDSNNPFAQAIPTYLGKPIIIDDGMPNAGGVFETWIFGAGATVMGWGRPEVPTEFERIAAAGNGSGQEVLHNRVSFAIHTPGHAYIGTPPMGGPSNANTTNNLAAATSWRRVFSERKQIRIARLRTREF